MPAILTLTYTPNYPGNHRVCFRTTQPSYCCYTDDSTSFVGIPKTIEIELEDFELCLQDLPAEVGCAGSVVEGYIQPFCVEQGSDVNRIAFTATFPSTPCTPYEILCTESSIEDIQVTDPGSGYGPAEVPAIVISSFFGQDAAAEPVMECVAPSGPCFVASIDITNPGFNYYTPESITITIDPPIGGGTTATAEVVAVDDCGTFTVPNCDGTDNTTEYELIGTSSFINSINVCAGGAGPVGFKYTITENAIALPGDICFNLGVEEVGPYTCSISPAGTYNGKNYYIMVGPDCVTPYDRFIAPNVWTVWYSTGNGYVNQWVLSEGLNQYVYVQWYLPVSSSPNFPLGNWVIGPDSGVIDLLSTDTNCQVSCCNCVKYDVINNCYLEGNIDIYYTDCNQIIQTLSVGQTTATICCVRDSVWPVNKNDNSCIEIVLSATQDC